jgi:hypothetical protein
VKGNSPRNAQVKLGEARPREGIPSQIAGAAERRRNGVRPQRHSLVANRRQGEVHTGYIRRLRSHWADGRAVRITAEIQVVVGAGYHLKRPAGGELNHRGHGEVGQELVRCARVAVVERAGENEGSNKRSVYAVRRMSVAFCFLPSAFRFLISDFCLLPSAFCFLPSAFCFPPSAFCLAFSTNFLVHRDWQ